MIVKYLDLTNGKTASEDGISEFQLTEGNWSCDCNRALAFGNDDVENGFCLGTKRYIVYQVEPEEEDDLFDPVEVRRKANADYYI